MKKLKDIALWLLIGLASTAASAVEYQDPALIRQVVNAALETPHGPVTDVQIEALDRRLRLKKCPQLPVAKPPGRVGRSRIIVQVSCPGSWTIYVPVSRTEIVPMVTVQRPLGVGQTISAEDLSLSTHPRAHAPLGYFGRVQDAVGQVARQPLGTGQILRPTQLRAGQAVTRGEEVRVLVRAPGFEISSRGVALESGALGGRIRVRNLSSERIVEGKLLESGVVLVN